MIPSVSLAWFNAQWLVKRHWSECQGLLVLVMMKCASPMYAVVGRDIGSLPGYTLSAPSPWHSFSRLLHGGVERPHKVDQLRSGGFEHGWPFSWWHIWITKEPPIHGLSKGILFSLYLGYCQTGESLQELTEHSQVVSLSVCLQQCCLTVRIESRCTRSTHQWTTSSTFGSAYMLSSPDLSTPLHNLGWAGISILPFIQPDPENPAQNQGQVDEVMVIL